MFQKCWVDVKSIVPVPFLLLSVFSSNLNVFAGSPQVVSGAAANLDSNGTDDGVQFTGQAVTQTVLQVPQKSEINKHNNSAGVTTDAANLGILQFTGSKDNTDVKGTVGSSTLPMGTINDNSGGSVTFYSPVFALGYGLNSNTGSVEFKSTTTFGAGGLSFGGGTTVTLDSNVTLNANISSASQGTFQLKDNTTINGNVNVNAIIFNNSGTLSNGAVLNGNVNASILSAGLGVIIINGNLDFSATRNTVELTANNFVITPIPVSGTVTISGPVTVDYENQPLHAPRLGEYTVVSASGGTSGAEISVIQHDSRYISTGSNINGNIIVTSVHKNQVVAGPLKDVDEVMLSLLPLATATPFSDLDFVEGQLGFPTVEQYAEALYQIAPNTGNVGVGRETFISTKQFLKVFLEHLQWSRSNCLLKDRTKCERSRVWMDGFGYFGHQGTKNQIKGYKVDTWGTMLAGEKTFSCHLSGGLGLGYAYSDINVKGSRNTTKIHDYQGTAYISYQTLPWFLDGGVSFGWNRYDGRRYIAFQDLRRSSHAKYNGQEYTGFITGGYQRCFGHFEIIPLASLIYSHVHLNSYHEKGAKTLSLKIKEQHFDYLESGLGLKIASLYTTFFGPLIPEFHTIWIHDYINHKPNVRASFSELGAEGGYFNNKGQSIDPNTWNVGASVTVLPSRHFSVSAIYDYNVSSNYYAHQGMIELGYDF
ncbi:MAG: autotransporter domain-containing protein [Verrucomicrobia bacterium]|nr:autotransporter domain-containing protein [Verrucomicrobiota bacterium]